MIFSTIYYNLLKKERLLRNMENRRELLDLESKLGYSFENVFLLHEALTHTTDSRVGCLRRSGIMYAKRTLFRLKTLGLNVLKAAACSFALSACEVQKEGPLTECVILCVRSSTLVSFGELLRLDKFVEVDKGNVRNPAFRIQTLYPDFLYAIFGAVFVDSGGASSGSSGMDHVVNLLFRLLYLTWKSGWTEVEGSLNRALSRRRHGLLVMRDLFPPPGNSTIPRFDKEKHLSLEDVGPLEKRIKYKFKSRHLVEEALTHDSLNNFTGLSVPHYERLEFLGDAIFELVIAEYLYWHFVNDTRGVSFNKKTIEMYSNGVFQTAIAFDLDLETYIRRPQHLGGRRHIGGGVGDFVESLVAAVYVDSGSLCEVRTTLLPLAFRGYANTRPDLRLPFRVRTYYGSGYHNDPDFEPGSEELEPPAQQPTYQVSDLNKFMENWEDTSASSKSGHVERFHQATNHELRNQFERVQALEYLCNQLEFERVGVYRVAARKLLGVDHGCLHYLQAASGELDNADEEEDCIILDSTEAKRVYFPKSRKRKLESGNLPPGMRVTVSNTAALLGSPAIDVIVVMIIAVCIYLGLYYVFPGF